MSPVTWNQPNREAPDVFDVVIIGGGIVGCAVARELTAFDLTVALVEARADIGDVTSKSNTAILHTGFDATPGSLESRSSSRVRTAEPLFDSDRNTCGTNRCTSCGVDR